MFNSTSASTSGCTRPAHTRARCEAMCSFTPGLCIHVRCRSWADPDCLRSLPVGHVAGWTKKRRSTHFSVDPKIKKKLNKSPSGVTIFAVAGQRYPHPLKPGFATRRPQPRDLCRTLCRNLGIPAGIGWCRSGSLGVDCQAEKRGKRLKMQPLSITPASSVSPRLSQVEDLTR
jgi:hypothetical protein